MHLPIFCLSVFPSCKCTIQDKRELQTIQSFTLSFNIHPNHNANAMHRIDQFAKYHLHISFSLTGETIFILKKPIGRRWKIYDKRLTSCGFQMFSRYFVKAPFTGNTFSGVRNVLYIGKAATL